MDNNSTSNSSSEGQPFSETPEFILDIANGYDSTIKKYFPKAVKHLKILLDDIIKTQRLNNEHLNFFFQAASKLKYKYELIDQRIVQYSAYDVKAIDLIRLYYDDLYPTSIAILSEHIINFLKNLDLRKLKNCDKCGEYFIGEQLRTYKFCSKKCKRASKWPKEKWNAYMKKYRADKKKKIATTMKKLFENEVNRQMKILGISREEAERMLQDDAKT